MAQQSPGRANRPAAKPTAPPAPAEPTATSTEAENVSDEKSPPTDEVEKDGLTETDIDATQSATFNSKDRVAVFTGNVKVTDPRFQLVCDRLTVFLNKPVPAGQNAATPAPTAGSSPATGKRGKGATDDGATPSGGSGIDHAVAEGHVVILQKKAPTKPGEEEKVSIGRGETGTFDNKSGDMVLKGWPSLEQNGSSLIATSAGTVMTIHRDSSLDTNGPSKTKLIQHGKGGGLDIPTGPTANAGRRGGPAPTTGTRTAPAATPSNSR